MDYAARTNERRKISDKLVLFPRTGERECVLVLSLKLVGGVFLFFWGGFFCSDIFQVQVTTSHIEKIT